MTRTELGGREEHELPKLKFHKPDRHGSSQGFEPCLWSRADRLNMILYALVVTPGDMRRTLSICEREVYAWSLLKWMTSPHRGELRSWKSGKDGVLAITSHTPIATRNIEPLPARAGSQIDCLGIDILPTKLDSISRIRGQY